MFLEWRLCFPPSLFVCSIVCLTVGRIFQKVVDGFGRNWVCEKDELIQIRIREFFFISKWFFTIERYSQKRYIAGYLKKVMDGFWRNLVDELVRWQDQASRFDFSWGPNPDPVSQWDIKRKLFSLVEECALPSAVVVVHISATK